MRKQTENMTLSMQCMRSILQEMRFGKYKHLDRLPPEVVIAVDFNVSRTIVRDSLAMLEREGFISRKHGIGTIVNRHVMEVTTRIDLEKEYLEMVRDAGFVPSVKHCRCWTCPADETVAGYLQIQKSDPVMAVERLICADGVPAIFGTDYVAKSVIVDFSYTDKDCKKPIFDFLKKFCNGDVYMDLSELHSVNADRRLAEFMDVSPNTALLNLKERGFSFMGKVLLYSDEYYRDDILKHTILRKKI